MGSPWSSRGSGRVLPAFPRDYTTGQPLERSPEAPPHPEISYWRFSSSGEFLWSRQAPPRVPSCKGWSSPPMMRGSQEGREEVSHQTWFLSARAGGSRPVGPGDARELKCAGPDQPVPSRPSPSHLQGKGLPQSPRGRASPARHESSRRVELEGTLLRM